MIIALAVVIVIVIVVVVVVVVVIVVVMVAKTVVESEVTMIELVVLVVLVELAFAIVKQEQWMWMTSQVDDEWTVVLVIELGPWLERKVSAFQSTLSFELMHESNLRYVGVVLRGMITFENSIHASQHPSSMVPTHQTLVSYVFEPSVNLANLLLA